jgi:inhibitor of KinA
MKIDPLGDSAYILRGLDVQPASYARILNRAKIPGLKEAVASYETVGLYVDPFIFALDTLHDHGAISEVLPEGKHHVVPVCYELGLDHLKAADRLGMSVSDLQKAHSGKVYDCHAVGFCPGFAYLGYLPDAISGLPRLNNPRLRVPRGSVAITGRQTAVYPLERPGGWWLIGRTPLVLVDPSEDFFPISAGDTILFQPITVSEFEDIQGIRLDEWTPGEVTGSGA